MTHPPSNQTTVLLDPVTATVIANRALSRQLGTTTLSEMEVESAALEVQLRRFVGAGLPEDEEEADEQSRQVQSLIDSVPGETDFAFASWTRMRHLARALRRHVEQYAERNSSKSLKLLAEGRDAHLTADSLAATRGQTLAPVSTGEGAT
ncbi:hypothetical protein ACN6LM_004808 [Streptomyces sp. SAS_281]|uniref:hypothetical protein n=1 Tax=Streptomyces sp. SAS_281 TaxID=3412744 RepID=UPI00403D1FF3